MGLCPSLNWSTHLVTSHRSWWQKAQRTPGLLSRCLPLGPPVTAQGTPARLMGLHCASTFPLQHQPLRDCSTAWGQLDPPMVGAQQCLGEAPNPPNSQTSLTSTRDAQLICKISLHLPQVLISVETLPSCGGGGWDKPSWGSSKPFSALQRLQAQPRFLHC